MAKLTHFLKEYAYINVKIIVDYGVTDIVAECYDVCIRFGEQVIQDMITVRISPDVRMTAITSSKY